MELSEEGKAGVRRFFDYARERHNIFLLKESGEPKPWTDNPIFLDYKFTNIFREDDRVTRWLTKYVKSQYADDMEQLFLATTIFRWFNRIRSGEAIFLQRDLFNGLNAFEASLGRDDPSPIKDVLARQGPPYMTGAYIIVSVYGMPKLDGVVEYIRRFMKTTGWREYVEYLNHNRGQVKLYDAWKWFEKQDGLGPFLAYEVVTDLRHTPLLDAAPDIMTWANPGPGALRGTARVLGTMTIKDSTEPKAFGRKVMSKESKPKAMELMEYLVYCANTAPFGYWPKDWPRWEMRDAEHTLCEFDKYERTRLGQGTPRGRYNGRA